MQIRFALAAFILAAAQLSAQTPALSPGDSRLDVAGIRTGTDSFRIESNFGGRERRSTMIRTVTRSRDNGRDVFVFAQRYRTDEGNTVDTSWVDARTLAPVRYFADVYGEIQKFTFTETTIRGTVTPKDSATRDVQATPATPLFNAVALDLLYDALPLATGFASTITLYNPPRASFAIELRLIGEEVLPLAAGGTIKAWKLDYKVGPNAQQLWLDRATGAFLKIGTAQGANWFWKYRADLAPPLRG